MSWKVVSQTQGPVEKPSGQYVAGWSLQIQVDDGNTFTVDVTDAEWHHPETVKAEIQAIADTYKQNLHLVG